MRGIMNVLQEFCNAAGQKINPSKTIIYFSKNVGCDVKTQILDVCGFNEVKEIGRYLGTQILNGCSSKRSFEHIIDRVKNKLKGWKSQCLSLTVCITLAQSVIGHSTIFQMQHDRIPKGICYEIEKLQRAFIWGDSETTKKAHLISWDTMCLPKTQGGLGFRRMKVMNDAFIMKLGWEIVTKPDYLWVQILIGKYGRGQPIHLGPNRRKTDSNLWKAIVECWPHLMHGLQCNIRNGQSASFWNNQGMDCGPLNSLTIGPIADEDKEKKVVEYVDSDGNWNIQSLENLLPENIIDKIRGIAPPDPADTNDGTKWRFTGDGMFSIKSAYESLADLPSTGLNNQFDWKLIWNWKGPQRMKIFLWQIGHDRITTTVRRNHWFGTSPTCHRCPNLCEDTLHVLRDCPSAAGIWIHLIKSSECVNFFTLNLTDWIQTNLSSNLSHNAHWDWPILFMVGCWRIWNWRNKEIFENDFGRPTCGHKIILDQAKDILDASSQEKMKNTRTTCKTIEICWNPPMGGWVKLNTDGVAKGNSGMAGCGGLIRDHQGKWVLGFARCIGFCSAYYAELWGVFTGLTIALTHGYRKVVLECDSSVVIQALHKPDCNHTDSTLLHKIKNLINKEWDIRFNLVYREVNKCADWLANESLEGSTLGTFIWNEAPQAIREYLRNDAQGMFNPAL